MHNFSEQDRTEIVALYTQLGFLNADEILTAAQKDPTPHYSGECYSAHVEAIEPGSRIGATFVMEKNAQDGKWRLQEIHVGQMMRTARFLDGSLFINAFYELKFGELPHLDRIKAEMDLDFRHEVAKEFLFLDKHLEREFLKMGFDIDIDPIIYRGDIQQVTAYELAIKPHFQEGNGSEKISIRFFAQKDEQSGRSKISVVGCIIEMDLQLNEKTNCQVICSKTYIPDGRGQLTKNEIIKEITHLGELKIRELDGRLKQLEKANKIRKAERVSARIGNALTRS